MTLKDFSSDVIPIIQCVISLAGVAGLWLVWRQIQLSNIWNRANTHHFFLSNLPSQKLEDEVWKLYEKSEKDALGRITCEASEQLYKNIDSWLSIKTFLNKFEQLCAAVNANVIDERYAYDVHGVKVVDAFCKFEEYIIYIRGMRNDQAIFLELEKVSTRWQTLAKEEQDQIKAEQDRLKKQRGTKKIIR